MRPTQIKTLQARSRDLNVMSLNPRTFVVESRSNEYQNHIVHIDFLPDDEVKATCTCPWSQYNGVACAHAMAAMEYLAARKGRRLSFWLTEDDARRQKRRVFFMPDRRDDDGVWITSRAG